MKLRGLVITTSVILIMFLMQGTAAAEKGPHGPYVQTPDGCAACHSTHTGQSAKLLKSATVRALCDTCHNSGYTGSIYDAEGGGVQGYGDSPAGPMKRTGEGGTAQSAHMLETNLQPPGGGASSEGLSCSSCHDPHGSANYRMFKTSVTWNGINRAVPNFTATYSTSSGRMVVSYLTGSVGACSACHQDYSLRMGGSYSSGFRHRVGVVASSPSYYTSTYTPLESQTTPDRMVCLTCHYAHGTKVRNTTNSGLSAYSSVLKRFTDSGMCSGCHFNKWQ